MDAFPYSPITEFKNIVGSEGKNQREPDDKSFALNVLAWDKAPGPGVGRVVPVIPHDEKFPIGNGQRRAGGVTSVVLIFLDDMGEFSGFDPIKVEVDLFESFIHIVHEFFAGYGLSFIRFPVDVNDFIFDFYGVSGNTDNSFNILLVGFTGVFKNDDISSLGVFFSKEIGWSISDDIKESHGQICNI